MDNHTGYARGKLSRCRCQAFCCYHTQGKGESSLLRTWGILTCQIVYDLHQVPRAQLPELRASIMRNLATFHAGPKPIRLQLCVCLANLAIQMTEWKDVLKDVVNALGSDPATLPCVLDFLRVLPEEVTHGRKIALTVRPNEPRPVISPRQLFPAASTYDSRVVV